MSPLVLEGAERGRRQTPGSEEPCLEVPKVLTLLKGAEVFTVPWERSQGGRRSGPGHQSRGPPSSLCSVDRPHPSPPRHGLERNEATGDLLFGVQDAAEAREVFCLP